MALVCKSVEIDDIGLVDATKEMTRDDTVDIILEKVLNRVVGTHF
jgi:hypothetical protein